jgi:hypothetical protein
MAVSMAEFVTIGLVTGGLIVGTMGAGGVLGLATCALAVPPTARMLFKCACDMILILERAFRYKGKYVSVKQIEDAAIYYTSATKTTFAGKELLLQQHIHNEIDRLIPLHNVKLTWKFSKLRPGLEDIIYTNRFQKTEPDKSMDMQPMVPELAGKEIAELDGVSSPVELPGEKHQPMELPAGKSRTTSFSGGDIVSSPDGSTTGTNTTADELLGLEGKLSISHTTSTQSMSTASPASESPISPLTATPTSAEKIKTAGLFSRNSRKFSTKLGLRKSKTIEE